MSKDKEDLKIIRKYFDLSRQKAGIVTLDMILRRHGHTLNHKKIARIKSEYGIYTKVRRRNPYRGIPLKSGEHITVPNLLKRDFVPLLPDEIYSTDMTYLYFGRCEKAYLSATKDLATNETVSYRLMRSPSMPEFISEFKNLVGRVPVDRRSDLIIHSDQGYQYTNPEFISLLSEAGIKQSMSRKANCLDNAPIESFFGHFKDLLEIKTCNTFNEVQQEVDRTIRYYNNDRPQKSLNKKPPVEYRGLLLNGFF